MKLDLSKEEIIIVLDALVESIAFDNDGDEIKEVYNKIIHQTNISEYEMLG